MGKVLNFKSARVSLPAPQDRDSQALPVPHGVAVQLPCGSIVIEVIGKPVPKGRPRLAMGVHTVFAYTPLKTRLYESVLHEEAKIQMGNAKPCTGYCAVRVMVTLEPPPSWSRARKEDALARRIRPTSRPDLDNYIKIACDALNGVVFKDDSQITAITATKSYGSPARIRIEVATP